MRGTHGWAEVSRERKREIIRPSRPTGRRAPGTRELDLTDRCNVACYFCNQQDLRTKDSIPLPKLTDLIDELAEGGLKSVRLSGGGDPLVHRDVLNVLDYLALKNVIVDNLTTNGVALNGEVARRLVDNKAREVIFSLNAADAADYARMMQVKPALFDKVLENIRNLIAIRGDSIYPSIVVQFLLDKKTCTGSWRCMSSASRSRRTASASMRCWRFRWSGSIRPYCSKRRSRHCHACWSRKSSAATKIAGSATRFRGERLERDVVGRARSCRHTRAQCVSAVTAFKEENGGCFFAWYTAAITGNGDIRPCCLLLNPTVKPLGNIHDGRTFQEHWTGPAFTKMRDEMRDVLLMKGKAPYTEKRFEILKPQCVVEGLCWLKNMYFRYDEEFYSELDTALTQMRKRELHGRKRAIVFIESHPRVKRMYDWGRERSRPLRRLLKKTLGINLTDSA
jgi:MoaA/NifB/PqqE/SkfB family radical SAM enzyme